MIAFQIFSNNWICKPLKLKGLYAVRCDLILVDMITLVVVKIMFFRKSGQLMVEYIMGETILRWKICLSNNSEIVAIRAWFVNGEYQLHECIFDSDKNSSITQYCPIRVILYLTGNVSFTVNRLVLNEKLNIETYV